MATWIRVAGVSIVVLTFSTLAFAAGDHPGTGGPAPQGPAANATPLLVTDTVEGVVIAVDARSGAVKLQTEAGRLALVVPSAWATHLHRGERVRLAIAFEPEPTAAASPGEPGRGGSGKKAMAWLMLILSKGFR